MKEFPVASAMVVLTTMITAVSSSSPDKGRPVACRQVITPAIQTSATIIAVARLNRTRLVAKRTAGATTAVTTLTATRVTMSRTWGPGCAGAIAATGACWINVTLVPVPGPPARMSTYAENDGAGAQRLWPRHGQRTGRGRTRSRVLHKTGRGLSTDRRARTIIKHDAAAAGDRPLRLGPPGRRRPVDRPGPRGDPAVVRGLLPPGDRRSGGAGRRVVRASPGRGCRPGGDAGDVPAMARGGTPRPSGGIRPASLREPRRVDLPQASGRGACRPPAHGPVVGRRQRPGRPARSRRRVLGAGVRPAEAAGPGRRPALRVRAAGRRDRPHPGHQRGIGEGPPVPGPADSGRTARVRAGGGRMSIDERGSEVAQRLRDRLADDLPSAQMLESLHRTRGRRRLALASSAVVAVVAVAAAATVVPTHGSAGPAGPGPSAPTSAAPVVPHADGALFGFGANRLRRPAGPHVPPLRVDSSPTWSPDGAQVAVLAGGILITDVHTGATRSLPCPDCAQISWSP